jgi:hypothetical protein
VRIGIPDQHIEDQAIKEIPDIQGGDGGPLAEKIYAIAKQRATFLLVLALGGESKCLAEVLLMNARDRAVRADDAVVSLDDDARFVADWADGRSTRPLQPASYREPRWPPIRGIARVPV